MTGIPSRDEIQKASALLSEHFTPTRLIKSAALSKQLGSSVHLKLELDLPTGSFKPRGALYALMTQTKRAKIAEVVASSTGNHGAAVAYAAAKLDIPATIFVPARANPIKVARIKELGARIVQTGSDLDEAAGALAEYAAQRDAFILSDVTNADIPAGAATIAIEILEQAPDVRTIIVPVGDTALIRGIGAVAKMQTPPVTVIGVQAANAPSYYNSWKIGKPLNGDPFTTIADGLATRTPTAVNVEAIRAVVDDMVLVTEQQMIDAIRYLKKEEEIIAEPSGAAAIAAALAMGELHEPAALIVSGGNLAPDLTDLPELTG